MDRRIKIYTNSEKSGILAKEGEKYIFSYAPDVAVLVSVTMPPRIESWTSNELHPIFQMNLPEGALKESIRERFGKIRRMDDIGMLEVLGPHVIGRVKYGLANAEDAPISLEDILHQDTHALFETLMDRFAIRSGVSGVQPKMLIQIQDRSTLTT